MTRTLIAGNWKMNGLMAALGEIESVANAVGDGKARVDVLLCVPATLIASAAEKAAGSSLQIGGETCHTAQSGAHTGDISAQMLKDAGASYVIVGHSERRADHGESDANVKAQAEAALSEDLTPIICIGESLEEREAGETLARITSQLEGSVPSDAEATRIVIAYEPIWAIGTGKVASVEQIGEVHTAIREWLLKRLGETGKATPILYGGSMKPGNAAEILAVDNVNGGLIGGASLKADDFLAIYSATN